MHNKVLFDIIVKKHKNIKKLGKKKHIYII